jgi:hypothetical protein
MILPVSARLSCAYEVRHTKAIRFNVRSVMRLISALGFRGRIQLVEYDLQGTEKKNCSIILRRNGYNHQVRIGKNVYVGICNLSHRTRPLDLNHCTYRWALQL